MFLKRVQVPDFRVLKNVDITFDPQLEPRVFPLGSQNGGGKSTLLQLIFVLLHCAIDPEKFHLVDNLLQGFNVTDEIQPRNLATIEIWDDISGNIKLEYLCYSRPSLNAMIKHQADKNPDCQNIIVLSSQVDFRPRFLACQISTSTTSDLHDILREVAAHTFLAAPSTQIFHFLSLESRKKLLARSLNSDSDFHSSDLQRLPSNLFSYSFSLSTTLIDCLQEFNDLYFLDHNIEPEDLSHGEFKRFSIWAWLSSKEVEFSIVLMDEIETALHPDWQYQIVNDLVDWGPMNQYILATHSYELCQAVTPAHVKELPKGLSLISDRLVPV
jgi:predicted ATP-dependent endonuclease of OLD family